MHASTDGCLFMCFKYSWYRVRLVLLLIYLQGFYNQVPEVFKKFITFTLLKKQQN